MTITSHKTSHPSPLGSVGTARRSDANRLAQETSPYLLQHAHNPVDWYPWGREAIERARKENKIIFLSIGYSSCHWCHVMERESFEDPEAAGILNAHFVAIKVDREERPDLDEIYMTAVQLMTGSGGWPLTVFLTPDLRPFHGGTYFPPENRYGLPSFKTVLRMVADYWERDPGKIASSAEELTAAIRGMAARREPAAERGIPEEAFAAAGESLVLGFDGRWGGFGGPPKFPPCAAVSHLLRQASRTGGMEPLGMATVTLEGMAEGGIHDHIGGGFHRYSVDRQWLVPHFEKMLYDNARLSQAYLEAWQLTRKPLYRRIVERTLDYVLRDMTDPGGGFYSTEDADSEGHEGRFYLWTPGEIEEALGKENAALFGEIYGVSGAGNFEGRSIPHLRECMEDRIAPETAARLERMRAGLLEARSRRPRPLRDDKVVAAWNGMMLSSFARAYQALGEERYLRAAEKNAGFLLREMCRDGVLTRTWRKGQAKQAGYLDDYAEVANGLLDLYEATFEVRWLDASERLARVLLRDFLDGAEGGFFFTSPAHHEELLARAKPFQDGAVPPGNSTAAQVLFRLGALLDNPRYAEEAHKTLGAGGNDVVRAPQAFLGLLNVALDFASDSRLEIAIAGDPNALATQALLVEVHRRFLPGRVLAGFDPAHPDQAAFRQRIPLLAGKELVDGRPTAYVCRNRACSPPVTDPKTLGKMLDLPLAGKVF